MPPINNSSSSPSLEPKTYTSSACSTVVTQPHDYLLKRSSSLSSDPLCESKPKRKKIADSREVRREKNKQAAALSRQRMKERRNQLELDNENLKKELSSLKSKIGITLDATISTSEQSQQSASPAKTTETQLQPLFPKPPALIKESELQRQERCMGQQSTPEHSLKEKNQIRNRVYSQRKRDAEKLALYKIETENANMVSEIESLKKTLNNKLISGQSRSELYLRS